MTNNSTVVPQAMAQSSFPQLQGAVSTSNQFGGGDMNSLGSGDMSADMSANSGLKNFKDIDDTCPSPGPGGMGMMGMGMGMGSSMAGGLGGGMEEMIGNVMMMPMMMAASSGLMGQGFRTFGPGGGGGGFRTYGPGGGVGGQRTVSLSKRGANDAGYFARRAAVRALRRVGR